MKNEFKDYFGLEQEIEFQKISNDYIHLKNIKYMRFIVYGVFSVVGFFCLKKLYDILFDYKNYKRNLHYKYEIYQTKYKWLRSHSIIHMKDILKINQEYLNKNNIDRILSDIENSIISLHSHKRTNLINLQDEHEIFLNIINLINKIIELDEDKLYQAINISVKAVKYINHNKADINNLKPIIKKTFEQEQQLKFLFLFYTDSYYNIKRLINMIKENIIDNEMKDTIDELKYNILI